jgi:integrase/recombinase XerD
MHSDIERFAQDLDLAGRSHCTKRIYLGAARDLIAFFNGSEPRTLDQDALRGWIGALRGRELSAPRVRHHLSALKFLYEKTLGRPEVVSFLAFPKGRQHLPTVLSLGEVKQILSALKEPKYRVFFAFLYGTGLRLNEAREVQTGDIDGERGVLRVRAGKTHKERAVALSPLLLSTLRTYWRLVRPSPPWLFASRRGRQLCAETARNALRGASRSADIGKNVTPHVFRHTFATHALEAGVDLRLIQVALGHRSIRSTARYASVSLEMISRTPSPFDRLGLRIL